MFEDKIYTTWGWIDYVLWWKKVLRVTPMCLALPAVGWCSAQREGLMVEDLV